MLKFELLECEVKSREHVDKWRTWRSKVVGGWLVGHPEFDQGMTFVPDPTHAWDGNSLP